jgi:hypothetical protein
MQQLLRNGASDTEIEFSPRRTGGAGRCSPKKLHQIPDQ